MKYRDANESYKLKWNGTITSIQARTRVWRYVTDNRTHFHIGYNIFLNGEVDGIKKEFSVAISEKQYMVAQFLIGDVIKGTAWTKIYPKREYADFYRAGALTLIERKLKLIGSVCPYTGSMPDKSTYEDRGARMLSSRLWKDKCFTCKWVTMANVEIMWDFDHDVKRYRFESFCYGPKSCKLYKRGTGRAVPCKDRDSEIDDGYLDELCTEKRGWDD